MLNTTRINTLAQGRVLVVGDVMLDHYVSGRVSRVSEEAPVPIIRVESERSTPGGAANVALNITALGGRAHLVGAVGEDHAGASLASLLDLAPGLDHQLVRTPARPTTLKTRYLGAQHQLLRVDHEDSSALSPELAHAVAEAATASLAGCGAVILSDYAKGVLTDEVIAGVIGAAQTLGVPVVIDPKRHDWAAYSGAFLITPNRRELALASGLPVDSDEDAEAAAKAMSALTGAAILLTRSERGMSLFTPGAATVHLPARAREVFDVSGAGDTVTAVVALALASGLDLATGMSLANAAAGVVVGKRGTATASREDIIRELGLAPDPSSGPGASALGDVVEARQAWAAAGLRVGFTNGCFDILHAGHIALIGEAAAACDRLIVAINSDASVSRLKGPSRPVQSEAARARVMSALRGVSAVVVFADDTPLRIIEALQPDVLIKGADYAEAEIVGADLVKSRGGRVIRVGLVDGQSSSAVIARSKGE